MRHDDPIDANRTSQNDDRTPDGLPSRYEARCAICGDTLPAGRFETCGAPCTDDQLHRLRAQAGA